MIKKNKQITGIGMIVFTCLLTVIHTIYSSNYNSIFSPSKMSGSISENNIRYIQNRKGDVLFVVNKEKLGEQYIYNIKNVNDGNVYSFDSDKDITNKINGKKWDNTYAFAVAFVKAIIKGNDPLEAAGGLLGSAYAVVEEGTIVTMGELAAEFGLAAVPEIIGLLSAVEGVLVILGVGAIA